MDASYESVVLLRGDEARTALRIVERGGPNAAMEHLKGVDVPGEGTLIGSDDHPWKETDTVFDDGSGFVLYYDAAAPYVGLVRRIAFD